MRICVENGMFTVSFLKEGITKVSCSEFLLSLLALRWSACLVPWLDR